MGFFGSNQSVTKCKKCGMDLHDHDRLKKHEQKAHGKKFEKCRVCGSEFYDTEGLRKHKKKCK